MKKNYYIPVTEIITWGGDKMMVDYLDINAVSADPMFVEGD